MGNSQIDLSWSLARALILAVAGLLSVTACSQTPPPATAASGDAETVSEAGEREAATAPSAAPPAEAGEQTAAEGGEPGAAEEEEAEWLVDEEGRRYQLLEVPKLRYNHRVLENGRVRIRYGLEFEIGEETDDAFFLKVYAPEDQSRVQPTAARVAGVDDPPPAPPEPRVDRSQRFRFETFSDGLPGEGQWRQGFDIGDMNADGHPDIVHGPPRKGERKPQIFLGDGQGSWRPWRDASYPDVFFDYGDAEAADFDGDGVLDLALAMHLRGVLAMVADGTDFERWSENLPLYEPERNRGVAPFSSRAIETTDWDGDGLVDLIVLGEGPQILGRVAPTGEGSPEVRLSGRGVILLLNEGDGTWTRVTGEEEDASFGDALALGDFDGDGRTDFVTASGRYGWTSIVKLGLPDGGWSQVPLDVLGNREIIRAVAAADLDEDRRDEIVIGYSAFTEGRGWRSGVDLLDRGEDGSWSRTPLSLRESKIGVWAVGVGDLDADGFHDIVATWGDGELTVLAGGADGFSTDAAEGLEGGGYYCRGYHVELADLDGRPGDELVIGFAGEKGSEVLIPGQEPRCPDGGGLHAWRLATP